MTVKTSAANILRRDGPNILYTGHLMYGIVCLKQSVIGPNHLGFWPGTDEDPGAVVSQNGRHWIQAREAALVCNSERELGVRQ